MVILLPVRLESLSMMEYPTETILSRGLLGFVVFGAAIVIVSADEPVDPNGEVDWVGAYLGVGALILFNFVWKYVFLTRNVSNIKD